MSESDDQIKLYAAGYPMEKDIWWFFRAIPGRTRGNIYNYNYWACGWCGWHPGSSELPQAKCGNCGQMIMATRKDAYVAIRPYIYNNGFRGHDLHIFDRDALSDVNLDLLRARTFEKVLKEVIGGQKEDQTQNQ